MAQSYLTQGLHCILCTLLGLLHEAGYPLESRDPRIAQSLVDEAFTGRYDGPLLCQPSKRDRNLFLIAAADPIRQHIDFVPVCEQVQGCLCNADM